MLKRFDKKNAFHLSLSIFFVNDKRKTKTPEDRQKRQQQQIIETNFFFCSYQNQQANSWCARGIELLASQRIENCSMSPEFAEQSLQELQQFVLSASEFCLTSSPRELRNVFQESATPETKALVTQVNST